MCGENHLRQNFPQRKHVGPKLYNAEEAETMGGVARGIPRIYKTLDTEKEDY